MEITASEIRLIAEHRAGILLKEMKESGERAREGGNRKSSSQVTRMKLSDLGITRDQSSRWKNISHESVNMSQKNP
jgi:hypothetical protein